MMADIESCGGPLNDEIERLWVCAHRGEARSFLKGMKPEPGAIDGLYRRDNQLLLICGEGQVNALAKTAASLARYTVGQVVNFGIAAAVDPSVPIGKVSEIRTVYCEHTPGNMAYASFTGVGAGSHDCVSAFGRVLNPVEAERLSHFAPLVDRELWSIAKACQLFHVPFRSFKLSSDRGDASLCAPIASQADALSHRLWEHCRELEDAVENDAPKDLPIPAHFHLSQSQRDRLRSLIASWAIRAKRSPEQLWGDIPWERFADAGRPKDRSRELLAWITDQINPVRSHLRTSMDQLLRATKVEGCQVQYDPEFESDKLQLSLTISRPDDLDRLGEVIRSIPYQKIQRVIAGDDVEL